MEHHVGIDVSLELSSLCVLDVTGKVIPLQAHYGIYRTPHLAALVTSGFTAVEGLLNSYPETPSR